MSESSFEDALSSIMGNEELMSKISAIASSHGGNSDEALPEVIEAISSSLGRDSEKKEHREKQKSTFSHSKNAKLLLALRPFLSEKRGQLIDSILKVEQIAEIMKLSR
ncbi:MAG: hypothetical protein J6A54_05040 [Clostridia bacterium]|nr:hypothetical protein [Clostridia bacterium]